MESKYSSKISEIGGIGTYDIFEVGGDVIAFAVKCQYVEEILSFLNSNH